MKIILSFLVCFLCVCLSNAQEGDVFHKVYTKQDGLEIDLIRTMAYDDDGYLWLGGRNLNVREIINSEDELTIQRFNGLMFHNISIADLPEKHFEIEQIYKRKDGKFYLRLGKSDKGKRAFLLFDPYTTSYEIVPIDWGDAKNVALSDIKNYNGRDYFLMQKDRTITFVWIDEELTLTPVFDFTSSENKFLIEQSTTVIPQEDYILVGDDNFPITFLDWEGNVLKRYAQDTFTRDRNINVKKFWIDEIIQMDSLYYAIINQEKRLFEIDLKKREVLPAKIPNSLIHEVSYQTVRDSIGDTRFITSNDGKINFYELTKNGFNKLYNEPVTRGAPAIIAFSNNVNDHMWVSTSRGELHYFKFPSEKIQNYLVDYPLRTVKPLDSNRMLVATDTDGWFTIDKNTGLETPFYLKEKGIKYKPVYTRNFVFEGNTIWSNSSGNILEVDKNTHETFAYRHYPVACLENFNDSLLLYGTNRYNLMTFNKLTKVQKPILKTDTLNIIDLKVDGQKVICGTDRGLLVYNFNSNTQTLFSKEVLEDPYILCVIEAQENNYLLGTREGHIISYNSVSNSFSKIYEDKHGAGIASIVIANKNEWWINTFKGVVSYDAAKKTTKRFSVRDGFTHPEGNRYSYYKAKNGIYFGALKGLNYFNPQSLQATVDTIGIELLRMRKYNVTDEKYEDILDRSAFAKAEEIVLPPENRTLELDFALTKTDVTRGESYRYRLNGGEWVNLRDSPSIRFPNLEAGDYTLDVEALDFSGKPIGGLLTAMIVSEKFFYKSWWFYLLLSLGSIGVLLWFVQQYRLRTKMQERFSRGLLSSQEEERNRIAKELHDSVGQQLTLIKQFAQREQKDEIATLTNNALNEVRSISRGLYPALLKQLGLTGSIEQLLLEVDEQTDLFVSVDIDEIDDYFSQENALNFYRFIQENVSNVVKHSGAKTLSVSIEKLTNSITATIADNGSGFNVGQAQKRNSLGLKTLEERIKILKGILKIESTAKGTTITAEIPLN